jgi:hypothetical protein
MQKRLQDQALHGPDLTWRVWITFLFSIVAAFSTINVPGAKHLTLQVRSHDRSREHVYVAV